MAAAMAALGAGDGGPELSQGSVMVAAEAAKIFWRCLVASVGEYLILVQRSPWSDYDYFLLSYAYLLFFVMLTPPEFS